MNRNGRAERLKVTRHKRHQITTREPTVRPLHVSVPTYTEKGWGPHTARVKTVKAKLNSLHPQRRNCQAWAPNGPSGNIALPKLSEPNVLHNSPRYHWKCWNRLSFRCRCLVPEERLSRNNVSKCRCRTSRPAQPRPCNQSQCNRRAEYCRHIPIDVIIWPF